STPRTGMRLGLRLTSQPARRRTVCSSRPGPLPGSRGIMSSLQPRLPDRILGQRRRMRMWALLYDPGHVDSFDHLGEAYAPLRRLIEELALKEYAGRVYAFDSGASFILTTAPDAQQVAGHDEVGIEYNPARGVFEVGYIEWAPPGRKARHRAAKSR